VSTGEQPALLGIEASLDDRPVSDAAHVERLTHPVEDAAGAAHAPADHGEPRDPVIVAHIHDERLVQRNRQRCVPARDRQRDDGRRIGNEQQVQLRRGAFKRGTVGAQARSLQVPLAAGVKRPSMRVPTTRSCSARNSSVQAALASGTLAVPLVRTVVAGPVAESHRDRPAAARPPGRDMKESAR